MSQLTRFSILATSIVAIAGGGYQAYNFLQSDNNATSPAIASESIATSSLTPISQAVISQARESTPSFRSSFNLGANLSESERRSQLEIRAQAIESSIESGIESGIESNLDKNRSRYVLANMYLVGRRPSEALALLTDLEIAYPIMAEYVLLKRSQALAMINPNLAPDTRNQILQDYPQSFAAAEALYNLGRFSEVLSKFPSHPRSRAILKTELAKSPNRFDLLIHMAVYFNDDRAIIPILDRLVKSYANQITSEQWSAIAQGYFDRGLYGKAANLAYIRATPDPNNLYFWGRSLQRSNNKSQAYIIYNRLVEKFPTHPLAPRAILRMIDIAGSENIVANVNKLSDRLVSGYPNTAAEGLLKKFNLLTKLGGNAQKVRNQILSNYPRSNEAGILTWQSAKDLAKKRNYKAAIALTQKITTNNPQAEITAEAGYWGGKWAKQVGGSTAKRAFELVISKHPDSYYAWRSAVQLGWQVGDFTTVRNVKLPLTQSDFRMPLPSGSATLQELYLLGQDRDASDRWQFETRGKPLRTPNQIFTDGVIRVRTNDNLRGLRQIESMYWLDVTDAEKADIKNILKSPTFSQTLYPTLYWEQISQWSSKSNLNSALVIGLIRQESRFESQIVSSAEAVGLMQIIPDTAAWIAGKKGVKNYNLRNPEQNVEFGTWYLDYTHREFGNNTMLALASYNAGPGRVKQWVNSFGVNDPEEFIERIPYDETRGYVRQVLGNYWNYLRLYSPQIQQQITQIN